ncbi:unnamed protein product [Brassica oleracea]|uniref:Ternary complex factor MIP1 leucine-zipper domain-containing protein n=2 Tax=Brassica TaxID=3705 RepID=A0A0D3DIV7_BRAOL|nr:unnamed protein product [Brassica napus]
MKLDRFFVTKCTLDMNSVIVQSSEDLKKEIAALEFEILRIEQYLLSLYMASFDEQVTSFSPHTETSLVSQSDLTGENTRYVYGHHTTLKDLLGSSHIVDDMENPSRFSEEILRCISSMYVT